MSEVPRPPVAAARRIVVKLGTRVVTYDDGRPALPRLFSVIEAAARLREAGRDVLIVSSGAVGLGMQALGFDSMPRELDERQACAAVGQTRLMGLYEQGFQRLGHVCGQVLLTRGDFEDRVRYLNLRGTLTTLLRRGTIPVINENDAVSTEELAYVEGAAQRLFGDNDGLSALVAAKLGADLLVLLTDVEGVYDRDPRGHAKARLLERFDPEAVVDELGGPGSDLGRGGMRSKLRAASRVARAGCHAVIASGHSPEKLADLFAGRSIGTWLPPTGTLDGRRRWIALAASPERRAVAGRGRGRRPARQRRLPAGRRRRARRGRLRMRRRGRAAGSRRARRSAAGSSTTTPRPLAAGAAASRPRACAITRRWCIATTWCSRRPDELRVARAGARGAGGAEAAGGAAGRSAKRDTEPARRAADRALGRDPRAQRSGSRGREPGRPGDAAPQPVEADRGQARDACATACCCWPGSPIRSVAP